MAYDRTGSEIFRDFVVDGVPASGNHKPQKSHIRAWASETETLLGAQLLGGGFMYATKAALDADLAKAAGSGAWVYADSTVANNGIYRKIGNSGSGSWTRATDLPFSVIGLTVTGGTANAIECASALPVPQGNRSALFLLTPTAANTGAVTLILNGASAVPLRWLNGTDLSANHLQTGNTVLLFKNGADYRLTQDSSAAGYAAAAAASAAAAEESADRVDLGDLDAAVAATAADVLLTAADRIAAAASASAAAVSEDNAEIAALASNAATPIYLDIATGRAAVANGAQFRVRNATGDVDVYTRTVSAQDYVMTLPAGSLIAAVGFDVARGVSVPAASGTLSGNAGTFYFSDTATADETIGEIEFATNVAGAGNIVISTFTGGNKIDLSITPISWSSTGVVTITDLSIPRPAGSRIGIHTGPTARMWLAAGSGAAFSSSAPSTTVSGTQTALAFAIQARYRARSGLLRRIADAEVGIKNTTSVGFDVTRGVPSPAATGTLAGNPGTYYFFGTQSVDETITDLSFATNAPGSGNVVISTFTGGNKLDISVTPISWSSSGVVTITGLNVFRPAGSRLGIHTGTARMWLAAGGGSAFSSAAPSTTVSGAQVPLDFALQANFRARSGLYLNVATLPVVRAIRTDFAAEYNAAPLGASVMIPAQASFSPSDLPRGGLGLYGDGSVDVNGAPFFISPQPITGTLLRGARSFLAPYIEDAALIFAGESDWQGITGSAYGFELVPLLTRALNLGAETPARHVQTSFGTIATLNTAARAGFTGSGTITAVDSGPLPGVGFPMAVDLASVAQYAFTATATRIGVFFDRLAGQGNIVIRVAGGATLATISAAGATDLTAYTSVATGSTTSQTYEIVASGGAFRLVGVELVGVVPAEVSGTQRAPARLPVINASRGSSFIANWTAAKIASAVKMASFGGTRTGRPLVLLRQGASDMAAGQTASGLQTVLGNAVDAWQSAGADVCLVTYVEQRNLNDGVSPSYPAGHEALVAAHRRVAKSRDVPLITLDRLPLLEAGMVPDGAHTQDAGTRLVAREIMTQMYHMSGGTA